MTDELRAARQAVIDARKNLVRVLIEEDKASEARCVQKMIDQAERQLWRDTETSKEIADEKAKQESAGGGSKDG